MGLTVIPTASWAEPDSFEYCFDGIETGAVAAVSVMQTKRNSKALFMAGFRELCRQKQPPAVICYGKPYQEMYGMTTIIYAPHEGNAVRKHQRLYVPGQIELFENPSAGLPKQGGQ
jgi:hypothetical protein